MESHGTRGHSGRRDHCGHPGYPSVVGLRLRLRVQGQAQRTARGQGRTHQRGRSAHLAATAHDGGARVTGYVIRATPGGKVAKTANVTSFTVGGLRDGTSYRFTVTAVNRYGAGPASRPSTAVKPRRPTAPSAPRNVTASAGFSSAILRWTAPANDGGAPITSYTITARPGHLTTTVPGDARNALVSGLTNGRNYSLTITAANGGGLMMARGKLVLSATMLLGNPAPALFGIDLTTDLPDWTYTDGERVGPGDHGRQLDLGERVRQARQA